MSHIKYITKKKGCQMKMEKNKKYNIGIDIGTNSVGWAVVETDTHKIIKKGKGSNRKALWGVRLFEKGETAESRRLARGTRRRYDRRRKRLKLLRREFAPYINEVDPTFFSKLNESFIRNDDLENKKIIMNDKELEEFKDLFRKFPTIYHLRERLINNPEKADIRHVYLAIHHIIKYRGNFLYDNNNFNVGSLNTTEKLNEIIASLPDYFNEIDEDKLEYMDLVDLERVFFINSKTDKRKELTKLLKEGLPSTLSSQLTSLLIGNQFSISKLFEVELEEDIKLTFRGGEFDELLPSIEHAIGEKVEILEQLKELYDMIFLKALFKESNSNSLSSLMTSRYKKHGDTLKLIREILKHDKDEFHKVFTNQGGKICLYNKYLNNKELDYDYDKFKRDLLPILKKVIKNVNNEELLKKYKNNIESKWEQENILPKITDVDNGKYPYQLNKDELIKIIENQGKHYPELLKKVNGTYKLVKLLEFRIPYYVGPLNNSSDKQDSVNQNAWAIKRFNSKEITPYNFEDVIDIHKSAEEFIMRMVSKCTYLLNENAIPANSILYSKFKVLNELKQIKVKQILLQ